MGCGSSTATEAADTDRPVRSAKTPSISSSSGVSSYRNSQNLRASGDGRPGSNSMSGNLNRQNSQSEQQELEAAKARQLEQDLQAEQLRRQTEEEEERQRRQREKEEEDRRERQRAEEAQRIREQEERDGDQGVLGASLDPYTLDNAPAVPAESGAGYTPLQIAQHNAEAGWAEWTPRKGKVYDGNGMRQHFTVYMHNRHDMMQAREMQRVAEGGEENRKEREFTRYLAPLLPCYMCPDLPTDDMWNSISGVQLLRIYGISEQELDKELPPFFLANVVGTSGPPYWSSVRSDVNNLLQELNGQSDGDMTEGEKEYKNVLTRWQKQFGNIDPPEPPRLSQQHDPNEGKFDLPVDPETLRIWALTWEQFDMEVPPEGAWGSPIETDQIELGDHHEVFAASLRINFLPDSEAFLHDFEGEAPWEILPDDVIKNEVMTPEQEAIQAARDKRTDLDDTERMRKRREALCDYFITTRELAPDVVMPCLQWATLMEEGMAQLQKLCDA